MSLPVRSTRYAMHVAIARLDLVLEAKASRGERLATPRNNLTVWRTQMRITTVKAMQNVHKALTKK